MLKDAKPLLEKIAAPLLASLIQRQIAELAHLQADELSADGNQTCQRPAHRLRARNAARRRHVCAAWPARC